MSSKCIIVKCIAIYIQWKFTCATSTGMRHAGAPIFHLRLLEIRNQLRAKCALKQYGYNDLKSVTDCLKRGLALSVAALAPENCLVLFPCATHLIKHARFSCSPDPSHLSFFHSWRAPSLIRTIATSTPARECVRACTHTYTHTLYIPVLFSFPFLFLSLGHASTPFSHPRSSFEFCGKRVSLSSFLPPFLPVSPTVFFSLFLFC